MSPQPPILEAPMPQRGDALLIVDVQADFLPGGALGVPDGDAVIAPLNEWAARFAQLGLPVVASRDWHPPDHCSFRSQGGPWPPHCVAGTPGAAFATTLRLPPATIVISKATERMTDAYSAFEHTGLAARLAALGCRRAWIGGLATDYCVRATALDAMAAGLQVLVLAAAVRAVDVQPGDGSRALAELRDRGARIVAP